MNYLLALSQCHPDAEAYVPAGGDPTVYNDLIWITTPIPEATLLQCTGTSPDVDAIIADIPQTVADGDTVVYNASTGNFEVKKLEYSIAGATDTNITSPSVKQILVFDGTNWVAKNVSFTGAPKVVAYGTVPAMYGTTRISYDNTTPVITEGTQLFSETVTPTTASSKMKISISVICAQSSKHSVFALFRDNICIGSSVMEPEGSDDPYVMSMLIVDEPNVVAPVTYSLRVGTTHYGGKWYVNKLGYDLLNGTLEKNGYVIEEFE